LWVTKQLKQIRQAAGNARDLDVLAARLQQREPPATPAYEELLGRIQRLRSEAQPPIAKIRRKLCLKDFARRQRALVRRVRLREESDRQTQATFGQAARRALGPLVEDFFTAAAADFNDYLALHAFRIQGKLLRYAMEIFARAFDRTFRGELYRLVEQLQEKLGAINDHATAKELFAAWLAEAGADADVLPALIVAEADALDQARQEFFAWWTDDRASELRQRFSQILDSDGREQSA
jgi:CHAD domain-containing protein